MILRSGRADEADTLSDLAVRSKGHWGYDETFLDACRSELALDAKDITYRRVVVAEHDGVPVGFYSLDGEPPEGELGYLFVEPSWIGHGIGRLLWEHMCSCAGSLGFEHIRIGADPGAAPFYEAMGARQVGVVPSGSIPGRQLPLLSHLIAR